MRDLFQKKYWSWRGRCGAYAKHHGLDDRLKRMNAIRMFYWEMSWKGTKLEGVKEL
jgi:hypothetical protein